MEWDYVVKTLDLLKEAEKTGEEVAIQCPVNNCDECPFAYYCK